MPVSVLDMETGLYPLAGNASAVPAIQVATVGWTTGGSGAQAGTTQDNKTGKSHNHE